MLCLGFIGCASGDKSPPDVVVGAADVRSLERWDVAPVGSDPESKGEGDAHVNFVRVVATSSSYAFHVTVQHDDKGWEDYCDGWDVVLPNGSVLKKRASDAFTRVLLHPHDDQPFTRSQSGLVFDAPFVTVRAHDLVHGFGGREVRVNLLAAEGEGFVVER